MNKSLDNISIGCISLTFSFSAVILSIIALCSLSDHTFVTDSALVSIVGIIVAVLIGLVAILIAWQVFNYFGYKAEMKELVDKSINEFIDDLEAYNVATAMVNNDVDLIYMSYSSEKQIEIQINSLRKALSCNHALMRDSAINYIMTRIYSEASELYKNKDEWKIPKGMREEYLRVLRQIKHDNIYRLIQYVEIAKEIDDEDVKGIKEQEN